MNQPWNNWNEALAKVEKVKGIVAAAPYINFTGLVESGNMRAIQVKAALTRSREPSPFAAQLVQNNAWASFKAGEQQVILVKASPMPPHVSRGLVSTMIPNSDAEHQLLQPKRVSFTLPVFCS